MSGPIQIQDTGDRWSHKHVSLNGRLFFTDSTNLADLYFRQAILNCVALYLRVSPHEHGVFYLREWNKSGRGES